MALSKQMKEGMSVKQKAMMGTLVVIVLVVIWQVVGLLGSSGGTVPPSVTKPIANQSPKTSEMTTASPGMNAAANGQTMQQVELKQAQIINDPRFLQSQQVNEQKYISSINDLEDLKIQRAIAETNQAIAAAKLATVTAEKNISDLLTKPTMPEVSAGTYANKLTSPTQGENVAASASTNAVGYTVISVSMQLGKWNAVLGYQGKLYNVVVGDVLAIDNSVVININKNGVILKKDDNLRKINITSSI